MNIDDLENVFTLSNGNFITTDEFSMTYLPETVDSPEQDKYIFHSESVKRKAIAVQIPKRGSDLKTILSNGGLSSPTLFLRSREKDKSNWSWMIWLLEKPIGYTDQRAAAYCYSITDYIKRSTRARRIPINPNLCANPFNDRIWITTQMAEPYLLDGIIEKVRIPGVMKMKDYSTEEVTARAFCKEIQACMRQGVLRGDLPIEDIEKLGRRSIEMEMRYRALPALYEPVGEQAIKRMLQYIRNTGGVEQYRLKVLRRTGRRVGRPNKYDDDKTAEIMRLKYHGSSLGEISKQMGIPRGTVQHIVMREARKQLLKGTDGM